MNGTYFYSFVFILIRFSAKRTFIILYLVFSSICMIWRFIVINLLYLRLVNRINFFQFVNTILIFTFYWAYWFILLGRPFCKVVFV